MRYLRFVLLPLLFVGCMDANPAAPDADVSPQLAAADAGWFEGTFSDEFTDYVPCVGEDVLFHEEGWSRYHIVVNGNRENWNVQLGMLPGYYAMGQTSGDLWLPKPSMLNGIAVTWVFSGRLGEPTIQVEKYTNARFDFVNQTTGAKLSWPLKWHVSRNAAGEVKVYFTVAPCR